MNHKSRNNILFRYINTYLLYYLFGNLSKKVLMFSIAIYLARTIDYLSIITFTIFYLAYMSIYFLNDYIDRHLDIKRKCIHPYKLIFSRKHLLILGLLHFVVFIAILYILNYKLAILSLALIFFGVLRSYMQNSTLREISLGALQFLQFCVFFYILGRPKCILEHIVLLLQFSVLYMFLYYIHKIPENGEYKKKSEIYVVIVSILSILALAEVKDLITLSYLIISLTSILLAYELFTKRLIKEVYINTMRMCSTVYYLLSIILVLFVLYEYFPEIPEYISNLGVMKFLAYVSGELKENITYLLRIVLDTILTIGAGGI